jgi:hypothetical protein
MFLTFNHLNEGNCTNRHKECRRRELHEGINPKNPVDHANVQLWQPGGHSCKNMHWEKLRR